MSSEVLERGAIAGLQVVVTGSSSGIGRAIAERLLALGCVVHGFDRAPADDRADRSSTRTRSTWPTAPQTTAAARACAHADALVHAAGVLRVGDAGHARSCRPAS